MDAAAQPTWFQDLKTIASIQFGDKLAVREGKLIITPAGFTQGITRTVYDIVYGGYNRDAVADHCSKLMKEIQDKLAEDSLLEGVGCRALHDILKVVKTSFSDIGYSYHNGGRTSSDRERFYILFDRTEELLEKLEKKVEPLQGKPDIDYDAPVNSNRIGWKMPEGYTPEDITKLAASARQQIIPTWKKIAAHAISWLSPVVALFTLTPLIPFKWVIWNPLEYILRGRITSMNPVEWYIDNIARFTVKLTAKDAEHAIGQYAHQLLNDRAITKAHLDAFRPLVKEYFQINDLSPGFAHLSFMQITSDERNTENRITLENFQELLKIFAKEPSCQGIHIPYLCNEVSEATQSEDQATEAAKKHSPYAQICSYLEGLGFKPKGTGTDRFLFIRK